MIDAVEALYGIKQNPGDRVIRIRGGEAVSDSELLKDHSPEYVWSNRYRLVAERIFIDTF